MQLNPLALALSTAGGSRWTPLNLFFGGIQGLWYDLNDDSTIFQDSAGTTLASWGDPVGRVNDKSGRGNNAVQSTAGSRPIRGRMPKRGRVNLLVSTESVNNAIWASGSSNITRPSANTIVETVDAATHFLSLLVSVTSGLAYTKTVSLQKGLLATAPDVMQLTFGGGGFGTSQFANVNVSTGAVLSVAGGATCTSAADPLVSGAWRFTYTATATATASTGGLIVGFCNNNPSALRLPSYAGSTNADCRVYRMQTEQNSVATGYQHVIDSLGFNVTETGQPSCGYLSYNGSNQWMQTAAAVNFSATDEMSVFAGVRKVSDAARGQLIEHSVNWTANVGSFSLRAPEDASNRFSYISAGNNLSGAIATTSSATYNAPINVVETGISDISADSCLLRLNGVQVSSSASDQGTGNYGNYVTYFGARAGTSLYFNGLMFSTIIRGALTSGTLLTRTEQYVARQTPTVNL